MARLVQNKPLVETDESGGTGGSSCKSKKLIFDTSKKVELSGCAIQTDRYYGPPCLKQTTRFAVIVESGKCS